MCVCSTLSVGNVRNVGRSAGVALNKTVKVMMDDGREVVVIKCTGGVTVLDFKDFENVRNYTWYVNKDLGYTCTHPGSAKTLKYMHRMLMPCDVPGLSVDHVNCIKTDNRRENLRLATQSQQNANRGARSDKSAPSQALLDAGIEFLPKGVRWDRSAGRYTCFDHALSAAGAYS